MSTPLSRGSISWRRAASVVLVTRWPRPGPGAPPPPAEDFRLLLLQRSQRQRFLPGAHVFPGGLREAADRSADWQRLFAPHHQPPRFGLTPAPPPRSTFPVLTSHGLDAGEAGALPDEVAGRICAIREAFEEVGVLLLRPRGAAWDSGPGSELWPEPACALAPPPDVEDWRERVRKDPRHFLTFCAHLDCTPDIWALHDWSRWLTPFLQAGGPRFDASFFLCCLREPPSAYPDSQEIMDCKWLSPSEAMEKFISKEIWLAPPQFYEMRRIQNFASLSTLHKFCLDRASEGAETWMPIILVTANGTVQLFPGDELYLEDSDYVEKNMATKKTIEEIMKESKTFHRLVMHERYFYSVHVTVPSKYKHVYPKTFVVNKNRL
ncbi:PREDICTED: nucleoside diphosphate-linked moiety X motif 19, mitochondrial [Elephantulus edwardii]|uniref:nucleoside diphosphate-linked moiety X motif 19, mitochondrial n=1 Tax=Elephantulus edwardii TaxID=28737 RepID=UPI0003F0EB02|nr:PREDICTED: nucleoside diphosphate-linked moiety X motif 19, mitochondrial [Elephantulus edwardii]